MPWRRFNKTVGLTKTNIFRSVISLKHSEEELGVKKNIGKIGVVGTLLEWFAL